jgi:hypothetical protein
MPHGTFKKKRQNIYKVCVKTESRKAEDIRTSDKVTEVTDVILLTHWNMLGV